MTTPVGRTIVLVTLLCCLPLAGMGGAVATAETGSGAGEPGPAAGEPEPTLEAFAIQDDGNETVRHRNPDEYDGDGDGEELERWLSEWLSDRLGDSARELSEGEYNLAREYVGEEYRDRLGQYVEVAGDGDDEENAYEEAQREQERLTEAVAEYDEVKAEYEAAREAGDDERARELARELESLAEEIGDASQRVQEHFDAISEEFGTDLTEASASVESTNDSVQSDQDSVREAEFVETKLTLEAATTEISFTDPLVGEGELRTADGDPIANEEIRLAIGNQELRVETDSTGTFDLEYRPISVPADAETVSVDYLPASDSVYLGNETAVPVSIEQIEPTLSVSAVGSDPVAYGDEVALESELAVNGMTVDGDVPLAVTVDRSPVGTISAGTTDTVTVPANVPAGERELAVGLTADDRALGNTEATTTVSVIETEPDLELEASRTGDDEIVVSGTLTAGEMGVAGEAVQLQVDGTTLETVTTDETGAFEGTVSLSSADAVGDVQLVAVHDDEGTNLAAVETATTVTFPVGDSGLSSWLWVGIGVVGLFGAVVGVYWYRSRDESESAAGDDGQPGTHTPAATGGSTEPSITQPLLSRATEQCSSGEYDDAVRTCYHAVRSSLEGRLETGGTLTHWEFYRQYQRTGDDRSAAPLRDVTEGYERAAFGRDGVSERDAETILERARELCTADGEMATRSAPADE